MSILKNEKGYISFFDGGEILTARNLKCPSKQTW